MYSSTSDDSDEDVGAELFVADAIATILYNFKPDALKHVLKGNYVHFAHESERRQFHIESN